MADDFGLLLEPVALERPARTKIIGVAAERMAHQRQVEAAARLRLPDVGHFVDEQALPRERLFREIVGPQVAMRDGNGYCPVGAIDDALRLERPPFAPDQADPRIIDRLAEHRSGELDFAESVRGRCAVRIVSEDSRLCRDGVEASAPHLPAMRIARAAQKHKRRKARMSETADRVKKIVVEHLGVEADKVTEEASFIDDLGADSLDIVELVMAFEEEFGVEIPDDAAEKITTVKDAIDYIDQNKG